MQGKYILPVLVLILILIPPSAANLHRINPGAPVFLGERDLDISKVLDSCRIISWWPEDSEKILPAKKNITLWQLNEEPLGMSRYTINVTEYANYTGKWYCAETQPIREVFDVQKPWIKIRVWDIDNNTDVSGMTLPATANITYQIETNLDVTYPMKYRPERSPADTFYTVRLTNPFGSGISNIYTGSYGAPRTEILAFDSTPFVSSSPFTWRDGSAWNRLSKNIQGDLLYPQGTYTFTVSQNLNGMQDSYAAAGVTGTEGVLTSSANITFIQPKIDIPATPLAVPATTTSASGTQETATPPSTTGMPAQATPEQATTAPLPVKTTYAPLSLLACFAGLILAVAMTSWMRR